MVDPRERAKQLLVEVGVSDRQRAFFHAAIDGMPEARAEEVADGLEAALAQAPAALATARDLLQRHREKARRALLVSDDAAELESLAQCLKQVRIEVEALHDATAALAAMARGVDVVICDFQMREMSGLELISMALRTHAIGIIRTRDDEEAGNVLAHEMLGYPRSAGPKALAEAVFKTIAARRAKRGITRPTG